MAARVEYARAVERARYPFVLGHTKPFDEVYPRSLFEKRAAREMTEERALKSLFHLTVTSEPLAREFDRIEKTTRARDQWEAIKKALGGNRRLIEEVFCRPLLVDRALRARFAFDQRIHAGPHQAAREARAAFLAGHQVPGASSFSIRRQAEPAASVDELLGRARDLPRTIAPAEESSGGTSLSVDPEMTALLERELKRPGDVTTILEERDRFEIFRLVEVTRESWKVETATFPKVDFDSWLEKNAPRLQRRSR